MLCSLSRGIRADLHAPDLGPLEDHQIASLADLAGLVITRRPIRPPAIGLLARGTLHLADSAPVYLWRLATVYCSSRLLLYGRTDRAVLCDPPRCVDERRERGHLLTGRLLFGLPYEIGDPREALQLAEAARVPVWYVRMYEALLTRDRARRDLWHDPDLHERVRRRARERGLSLA